MGQSIVERARDGAERRGVRIGSFTCLVVGLNSCGKNALIDTVCGNNNEHTDDGIVRTVSSGGRRERVLFKVISGAEQTRDVWADYAADADALIVVVDCTDWMRFCVISDEMGLLLRRIPRAIPILVAANRSAAPGARPSSSLYDALGLDSLMRRRPRRTWHVCPMDAVSGVGCVDGLTWLFCSGHSTVA